MNGKISSMPSRIEANYGKTRYDGDLLIPFEEVSAETRILKKAGIRLGELKSDESSNLENGEVKLGTDSNEYHIGGPVLGGKTLKSSGNNNPKV